MQISTHIGIPNRQSPVTGSLFSPVDVSGLVGWWRADLGITIATGVSAWADQSGTGNHLAQLTPANQPAFTASVAALGGKPALTFNGATKVIFRDPLVGVVAQPNTLITVSNLTDNSILRRITDGNGGGRQSMIAATSPSYQISAGAAIANFLTATGGHINMATLNGVASQLITDGLTVNGDASTASLGAMYIGDSFGGGANWVGDIPEVMVYSRALSAAELGRVRSYLKSRYAL